MYIRLFLSALVAAGLAVGAASAAPAASTVPSAAHHDAQPATPTHHRYNSLSQYHRLEAEWTKTYALPAHPIPYADLASQVKDPTPQPAAKAQPAAPGHP